MIANRTTGDPEAESPEGQEEGRGDDEQPKVTEQELTLVEKRLNERAADNRATRSAAWYWANMAQHWNDYWDDDEEQPDMPSGARHPASVKFHDLGDTSQFDLPQFQAACLREGEQESDDPPAPEWLCDDVGFCRNMMTRHTDHVPYCLRRNKETGQVFCRFHYPLEGHTPVEDPHFYVERNGPRFRWKLNLGINDRLINSVNLWQMAAHRANVDFRPLFDHHSAVEYATKYATKAEKGSKASDAIFAHAISRASKNYGDDESAQRAYSSFLVQTVGARDWSAQEVGHVAFGHHTCISSHSFDHKTLTGKRALLPGLKEKRDDENATSANKWDLYLRRIEFASHHKRGDPKQQTMEAFFDRVHNAELTTVDDKDHIVSCSFHDFYSHYTLASAGAYQKGRRSIVRRKTPTVVVIKPRMPKFWCQTGHPKRREYCRNRLLLHRTFLDLNGYTSYMQTHQWDWESAYEDFALSDHAPPTVRDDFRHLEFDDEGEEVEAEKQPMLHGRYSMLQTNVQCDACVQKINVGAYDDWEGQAQSNFTDAEINDSATWMSKELKNSASREADRPVDVSKLNRAQAFVYSVVERHARAASNANSTWAARESMPKPLRALVCGTAGSGKVRTRRLVRLSSSPPPPPFCAKT